MIRKISFEKVYALSVTVAMSLLFFANAEQQTYYDGSNVNLGIGKMFYIPCGIALICSLQIKNKKDSLDYALNWLITVACLSCIIHPAEISNILEFSLVRFIFGILCFKKLKDIDPLIFIRYVAIASPFIVFPHYILTNPFAFGVNRYGGFYGDANFLALALNIVIAICYMAYKRENRIKLKLMYILSMLGAVPLILVGMSRGGIIGLVLIFIAMLCDVWKSSRFSFGIIILLLIFGSSPFFYQFGDIISLIEYRFSGEASTDAGGAMARWDGIVSVLNVFSNRPDLIPFGIGFGNTLSHLREYMQYGFYLRVAIHNTYFLLLYEAGLIALLLYLYIYLYAFRNLKKNKNYFLIGLLISAMLSLATLPGVAFMPGWILLFFLSNKRLKYFAAK